MPWLEPIIDFLIEKDGIVAITTMVLVGITGWYTHTTKKILNTYDKPEILIYLFPSETSTYSINLCIHNIGTGYAKDVKFSGDLSFVAPNTRVPPAIRARNPALAAGYDSQGIPLGEISIFKYGIDYFPPGRKFEINLFNTIDLGELLEQSLNLTATYKDSRGKDGGTPFELTFKKWEHFTQSVSPNATVAQSLTKIADDIGKVLTHLSFRR